MGKVGSWYGDVFVSSRVADIVAALMFVGASLCLIMLVSALGLSYTGMYSPAIDHVFEATVIDTSYNGELSFTENQVEEINSMNGNSSEVGWCFDIVDGEVTDFSFEGYGEERMIKMDCGGWDGELHTHNLLTSSPQLSDSDYNSLVAGGFEAECVVSGVVEKTGDPVSINCFNLNDNELYRYSISVV